MSEWEIFDVAVEHSCVIRDAPIIKWNRGITEGMNVVLHFDMPEEKVPGFATALRLSLAESRSPDVKRAGSNVWESFASFLGH